MAANRSDWRRLTDDVFATEANEIQCEQAADLMVRAAAAHLSDEASRAQYPALWQHFRFCASCAEEYRLLVDMAAMEQGGALVTPRHLPPRPDTASTSWRRRMQAALRVTFPGFTPELALALTRGEPAGITWEPVVVTLEPQRLEMEVDVAVSADDPDQRSLLCTVRSPDATWEGHLEGISAWLQAGGDGPVLHEKALDEWGDVAFGHVSPGTYSLWLDLPQQPVLVSHLVIP